MAGGREPSRYQNPAYDALFEEVLVTSDPERAAELFIQMNDILIDDAAVIPLVQRRPANRPFPTG